MTCAHCGASIPDEAAVCPACGEPHSMTQDSGATPTGPVEPHALPGARFGPGESFGDRYTIVEEVGEGGMGEVFKAIDRQTGRTVALKLIRARALERANALERFRRELALAQKVTHPNVCRVYDLGEVSGLAFISMEFVEGQTLDDLIQSVGRLSPRQTLALGQQICSGLEAIHAQAIVHRDLKPGNIMVDRAGHAIVMDFGTAYHPEADKLTRDGAVLGTIAYLSPEQARGQATDARSDVWAVGLVLFEMLTGKRAPGDGSPIPLALRENEGCPPPSRLTPEVRPALDAIIARCLARDPKARYGSATELRQALADVAGVSSSSGPSAPMSVLGARPGFRAVIAVAGVLFALGLLALWRERSSRDRPAAPASIALLPLEYEGAEPTAYLRDVIPAVLAKGLGSSQGLVVAPYGSSRSFAASEPDAAIAHQLGVSHVLRGKVRVDSGQMHASLRLMGVGGSAPLWTREIASPVGDLVRSLDGVAASIAERIGTGRVTTAAGLSARADALAAYREGLRSIEGWDGEPNPLKAEEAFRRALSADTDFAEAHAGLARALWQRHEQTGVEPLAAEARAAADRALRLGPFLPEANLAWGLIQLGSGNLAEAAAAFRKAQEWTPADDTLCRQIAEAYASHGHNAEAERAYDRAIAIRPGYWDNYNQKSRFLLRLGRLEEARALLEKAVRLPEGSRALTNLASAYLLDGRMKEAQPILEAALLLEAKPETLNNLGIAYYGTGDFEQAAAQFRRAAEAVPEDLSYWGNLGDALRQLGRREQATAAYGRAIDLGRATLASDPQNSENRAGLAMYLAGCNRCAEARVEARRAEHEAGAKFLVFYYSGIAYVLCGERRLATDATLRAIEGGAKFDVLTNPDLRPLLTAPEIRRALGPAPKS